MSDKARVGSRRKRIVLSIDGGGVRGLIPALVIAKLEELVGRPMNECVDLIAGTSSGGMLALGLSATSTKDAKGRAYSGQELVAFCIDEARHIFPASPWRRFSSLGGIIEERYDAESLEELLRTYFLGETLDKTLTEVLVPAYEIERRIAYFFKSTKAREHAGRNFKMWEVARSTSAAPTYFEPARIQISDPAVEADFHAFVDGGVFANNPAMCAFIEARKLWKDAEETHLISLGTGELTRRIAHHEARNWGMAGWAHPMLDVVFDGVSDTVHHQLRSISGSPLLKSYHRFQTTLDEGSDSLDDSTVSNLRLLQLKAEELLRENEEQLEDVVRLLEGHVSATPGT